ncbi:lipase family protein [Rhodococcus wratislaviensis]|nr:lipase family protein [Rhodococcus wratislaviensis]
MATDVQQPDAQFRQPEDGHQRPDTANAHPRSTHSAVTLAAMPFIKRASIVGPTLPDLKPAYTAATYEPVYHNLVDTLLTANHPSKEVRHVLATCAGYAYGDERVLATMMTRLGLPKSRCYMLQVVVDAMFIVSTAYIVQSQDGRVVMLCYRGTQPVNVVNWLTDLDADPAQVEYDLGDDHDERSRVHAGFYRNTRATRFAVIDVLQRALEGWSIAEGSEERIHPIEALYITGHSLGGAMAILMTVMLHAQRRYRDIASVYRATYTFGQPMIGTPEFARACEKLRLGSGDGLLQERIFRYVYGADVVPQLPPRESGRFQHFGVEYRCPRRRGGLPNQAWSRAHRHTSQTTGIGLLLGGVTMLTRQIALFRNLPWQQEIADHGPHNYITALTPKGIRSEFG